MILILLTEIIAFHIRPIAVDVWGLGLEFVSRSTLKGMKERLDDSVQILLAISVSARILGNGKR